MISPIVRRWPKLSYFAFGFLVSAICVWLALWLPGTGFGFGMEAGTATRTLVLRGISWTPIAVFLILIALRITRRAAVRPFAFAAGGLFVPLLLLAWLFGGLRWESFRNARDFDPAAWRSNETPRESWTARLAMIDDLLERHPLDGLDRNSVEQLLGPGDETDYFREWDLVYWLGPERGFVRIDSEWLVVDFGDDGRVRDYRIVRD